MTLVAVASAGYAFAHWSIAASVPGSLAITWPIDASGFVLQQNSDLTTTHWVTATNVVTVVGTNRQVTITPLSGSGFFRLVHP